MMPLDLQHDFPHVVRLYYNAACLPEQFSGSGILLGSRHILTCAHVAEELEKHSRALTWFAREPDGTIVKVIKGTFTDEDERAANLTLVDLAVFELDSKDVEGRTRQPPGKPLTFLKRVTYPFLKTTLEVSEIVAAGGVELGIDPYGVLIKPPRADRDGAPVNFQCLGGIASGFSGGPAVMRHGHQLVCVGINWYGRDPAGNSRFLTGDTVYQFLARHRPELLDGPNVRFVDFVLTQSAIEAGCRSVLRAYNRRCRNDWKRERPRSFIAPRLAIRKTESAVLDRSAGPQQHTPLLSDEEKKRPGKELAVPQYRRLFDQQPAKPGSRGRICVTEDAGSGKSVFTRHLQLVLASEAGQQAFFNGEPGLVVRWEGRERSWPLDILGDLKQTIAGLCVNRPVTAEQVVNYAIEHGRVCLILDALDQVTDYVTPQKTTIERSLLLDKIFGFLKSDEGQKCHVVITGRSYAVTQEGDGQRFSPKEWVFATLEGFDERQQRRYLGKFMKGRTWTDFIPCHAVVAELLQVPVILSLIAEMGDDMAAAEKKPPNQIVLNQFKTRGDVYLEAHEKLVREAAAKHQNSVKDSDVARWELMLASAAFAMMCDEGQRRNYSVSGAHAVANFRRAAGGWGRQIGGEPLANEDQIQRDDWDTLTLFSQLTKHKSVEKSSPSILSWKHRGWMEYFAGLYLARYASADAAAHASQFYNDPDWFWTWRFAIETNPEAAIPDVQTRSISGLFRRPNPKSGRRPNELIYRAWEIMERMAQPCPEFVRFQQEYPDLRARRDPFAHQIETSFRRCPRKTIWDRFPLLKLIAPLFRSKWASRPTSLDGVEFLMGAPESDTDAYYNEKPQISRRVDPFLMSNAPITKSQFWLYDPGHRDDPAFADRLQKYSPQHDCPVIYVTWYDAWCFARWCGSRLPTEMEWEYACRAGTETRYWWGNEVDESKCTINTGHTTPAKQSHANLWELMEMSGNVWEWCDTSYVEDLARLSASDNTGEFRVLRGGSFGVNAQWLRSAVRDWFAPGNRDLNFGFRVSRTRIGF